jgi:predicted Zn-dependent protease
MNTNMKMRIFSIVTISKMLSKIICHAGLVPVSRCVARVSGSRNPALCGIRDDKVFLRWLLTIPVLLAQTSFAQPNIVQKAMQDEIDRSMKELQLDTLQKPCYVSCSINEVKAYSITAVLGGVVNSNEVKNRVKGNRVLVGTYELNDESLDNNLFSSPEMNDIQVPLDDDYLGIRRALWVSIDNVYKNAARQHAKNVETWKEQKKPLAEIPHRVFAKLPAVKIQTGYEFAPFDKKKWETNLRQLTQRFIKSDFPASNLSLNYIQGYDYFESSEGTSLKLPVERTMLQLAIVGRDEAGELVFDQAVWAAAHPDELPTLAQLEADIEARLKKLEARKQTGKFDDDYTGPVLLEGSSVADFMSAVFFMGRERLMFDNNIPSLTGFRNDTRNSMESRIGKNVASTALTVMALPHTKQHQGVKLLGAFEADSEGVIPPNELTLIDKGILKDLLNDRSLTASTQTANGHRDGPGVIQVSVSEQFTPKQLKEKLIIQAKEAGLEYALIIRNESFGRVGMFNVYKVNLETGAEEFQRQARFSSLSLRNLRKISGSVESAAYNLPGFGAEGGFASYIVPQGVLIGEVEIVRAEIPSYKEDEFVKDPLKQ